MQIRPILQIARAMFETYIEVVSEKMNINVGLTWEQLTQAERDAWVEAFKRSQKEIEVLQ